MDYYEILWLERSAGEDEIKKAYRKMAMKYHPDRNAGDKDAEKKFKEVNEAYSTLSDAQKKQQYDMFGKSGGGAGFWGGWGGFHADVDLWDIFSQFFWGGGTSSRQRKKEFKGEDLEYVIRLDLKTSILGGKKTITFERLDDCGNCDGAWGEWQKTCGTCHGHGVVTRTQQSVFGMVQQRVTCPDCHGTGESFEKVCDVCHGQKRTEKKVDLDIEIPAGIDNGMVIRMSGEGNGWYGTKARGDLFVKFATVQEEKCLQRDGVDLHYHVEVDVLEAILGGEREIKVPVIGKRNIKIKAGTQVGDILKYAGDGVKHIDSDKKWDLFFHLDIVIPKKLSKKEKALYSEIQQEKKKSKKKLNIF